MDSFGTKFIQDLSSQRDATELCFKTHATMVTCLADDILTVSKNLTTLYDATLSKKDIEHIVVKKGQDELDPHIQSHYDFKATASSRLDNLNTTL
jgi:hypothetical protein